MMSSPSERNNTVRLIRALEVARAIGHVPKNKSLRDPYDTIWIGIAPSMKALEKKISTRLTSRIKQGMIAEAQKLYTGGLSYKRMTELGLEYRFLASFLQQKMTRREMETGLNRAIRKYGKRQLAYWKRNKDIVWFEKPDIRLISKKVGHFLRA